MYTKYVSFKKWKIKEPEPELYYKWRLWLKYGDIDEPSIFLNEKGLCGSGSKVMSWHDAVKRKKISEGVAKVEGQY